MILAIPSAAYIARLARTFMLEVLQQDYIRTARAKGLGERLVIGRHALRNILVPLLTSAGIILGGLISNTFVVETIFNIPGLGRIAIDSIFARDYPVAMAIVVLFTLFFILINLAVDVAYALIDPRICARGCSPHERRRRRPPRSMASSPRRRRSAASAAASCASATPSSAASSSRSCS